MANKIKCTCGHSWNKSDSSKKDATVCHICGKDNAMKNGGWLDNYGEEANANEGTSSASKEWIGEGYSTKGRNYSPAWGGQFEDGGKAQKGKKVIIDGKEYDTASEEYKDLYRWGPNDDGKGGVGYFDEQGRLVTGRTTMPEFVVWNKDKKTKEFYDSLGETSQWAMDQMIKKYGPVNVEKSDSRGTGIFSKATGSYNPLSNKIKKSLAIKSKSNQKKKFRFNYKMVF